MNGYPRIRAGYAVFVAAVLALLLFAPSLGNGLAYDDESIVGMDPRVRSLASIDEIFTRGYWSGETDLALYRPLTTLSFALDWSIADGDAAWFHFTNVIWHALASALATLLLARFFAPAAAFAGGLVFAVHPVHVEAVANVVGRADVIAAALVLAACLVWVSIDARGPWKTHRAVGVAGLYVLGLLVKESAVMLPALLLLLDAARGELRRDALRPYLRECLPAFALLAFAVVGFIAVRAAVLGGFAPARVDAAFEVADTPASRIITALQAWPAYVRLLIFPRTLLADYGPRVLMPVESFNTQSLLGLGLFGSTLAGGVIALARRHGTAAAALLWFPIAIFPVSNMAVPIGVIVAERTLYLPSFALAFGVAAVASRVLRMPRALPALRVTGAILLVLLAGRSLARIPDWHSTDRILRALVRDRPDAFRGQWYLARAARAENDTTLALSKYAEALELWQFRQRLVVETAAYAAETQRLPLARDVAQHAVHRWPDDIDGYRLLAAAVLDLGDTVRARATIEDGLRVAPADELLLRMRAALDSAGGRP